MLELVEPLKPGASTGTGFSVTVAQLKNASIKKTDDRARKELFMIHPLNSENGTTFTYSKRKTGYYILRICASEEHCLSAQRSLLPPTHPTRPHSTQAAERTVGKKHDPVDPPAIPANTSTVGGLSPGRSQLPPQTVPCPLPGSRFPLPS